MIVTIHQPEHLPWLGFLDKARQADVLVLLDSVQYRKNYFQNRNRIRVAAGASWLTVPVLTKGTSSQKISEVRIDNFTRPRWRQKTWATLEQNYRTAGHWAGHAAFFRDIYNREWNLLRDINEELIRYLLQCFEIGTRMVRSSELDVEGTGSDLLLKICDVLHADKYLSGVSGKDYLDCEAFSQASIEVRFQEFHHPIYRQLHQPFQPCMSSIDLLFNYGPGSRRVLEGIGVETIREIFT